LETLLSSVLGNKFDKLGKELLNTLLLVFISCYFTFWVSSLKADEEIVA